MAAATTVLSQVAVYADAVSLIGYASEIDLPTINSTTQEHTSLGMRGSIDVPVGLDAMECRIKWTGHGVAISRIAYNLDGTVNLQIRGVLEDLTGPVKVRKQCTWYVKGTPKSKEGGKWTPKSLMEHESMFSVTYYKEEIDGVATVEIDVPNNIYRLMGQDQNADANRILGIN